MSPIYKEARRCYKAAEFPCLSVRCDDDGSAAVYSKEGKLLALFTSRLIAEREIEKQSSKASKFIQ